MDRAQQIFDRLDELGRISEDAHCLTRQYGSDAMRRANNLVGSWMKQAGMDVRVDAIGNLIGTSAVPSTGGSSRKTLLLGSHLDTVKNAGKYDGPLGVVLAIAAVEQCKDKSLPFDISVIGFADEEGVRFQSTYLGSRAVAGSFDEKDLQRTDANGVTLANAIKHFGGDPNKLSECRFDRTKLLGYFEVHIEQGPVLEQKNQAVGPVTAIAGQTRAKIKFEGKAGHAGTTPMSMRRDALCGAAGFIQMVESCARYNAGLVATIGQIVCEPNVSNVIPAIAHLTLDVRHRDDKIRLRACDELQAAAKKVAALRNLAMSWQVVQETTSVPCSTEFSIRLHQAILKHQSDVTDLPSGAGHDAAVMSKICPIAMLFVRCKDGLSHHPDESITVEDVRVALAVLTDFIHSFGIRK